MSDPTAGQRDQRLLHAWPDWDASIQAARDRLGFDPAWTPQPGAVQAPEYRRWLGAVELRRLLAEARRALIDLRLPERFRDYWLACFLAPYERDGLAIIRDPLPTGDITLKRVFPPPRALWFDAGIDYSSVPYKLLIEGPAALASSATLREAVARALKAKRDAGFPAQHPLARARQIGPALANRAQARGRPDPARERAMRQARAWHEKPSYIAAKLTERGYAVSEATVRRWLKGPSGAKSVTPSDHNGAPPTEP